MDYELIEGPSREQKALLAQRFHAHLQTIAPLPDESEDKPFMYVLYGASEKFVGGILANAFWDGLEIDTLWVDEPFRGRGIGAELLEKAEDYGRAQGAVIAYLKTVEAREFYEKQGYMVFGVLEDRPVGTLLYHMKKRLD